jgi:hypothetical protein
MVWAKIDDEILDNPKIAKAGPFGFAMHVAGITWCCRNLSDGKIPYGRVTALVTCDRITFDTANPLALPNGPRSMGGAEGLDPYLIADHLVVCGLWDRTDDGYEIHDFLEYNPSRAEVESKRSREAQRQDEYRKSRTKSRRDTPSSNGVSHTVNTSLPDPVPLKEIPPTPLVQIVRDPEPEKPASGPLPDGTVNFERTQWVAAYERAVSSGIGGPWSFPKKAMSGLRSVVEAHCVGPDRKNMAAWVERDVGEFVRAIHALDQKPAFWSSFGPDGLQRWHNEQRPGREATASASPYGSPSVREERKRREANLSEARAHATRAPANLAALVGGVTPGAASGVLPVDPPSESRTLVVPAAEIPIRQPLTENELAVRRRQQLEAVKLLDESVAPKSRGGIA